MKDTNIITMVDRAMKIIEYIYNSPEEIGVSSISKDLSLPKATVFRILSTLEKWNTVKKINDDGKYILGHSLIKYGEKAKNQFDIVSIVTPYLKKLSEDTGETINLGIRHKENILILKSIQGESSILVSKLIPISPLHCSSIGKLFLSNFSEQELNNYFDSDIEKRTINTIISTSKFHMEKDEILETNIAYDKEEYEYGLSCIASAIKDKNNKILAGISISGPTTRLQYKGMNSLEDKLTEITSLITKEISIL